MSVGGNQLSAMNELSDPYLLKLLPASSMGYLLRDFNFKSGLEKQQIKEFFGMKEYFSSQIIKKDWQL